MSQTGQSPAVTSTTILGLTPSQIVAAIGTIADIAATAFAPGLTVAGLSMKQIVGLATGLVNEVPEAIAAVDMIKGHAAAGTAPTAAEWATINSAADAANAAAAAAEDKVINGTA